MRLLGLNSSRWPRGIAEDRLLSDHIVPTSELDPLPVTSADRRDFQTILKTTGIEVVLSHARRDDEGRLLGRSALLLDAMPEATYLRRHAVPAHAFSETDRLMARPDEFRVTGQAMSAMDCWRDWQRKEITRHDGLTRADHPAIRATLKGIQSASSLRQLLRNPLGFVWRYGLGWRAPESGDEPLMLDPLSMGDLVHRTLERALRVLEADGRLSGAGEAAIVAAVNAASTEVVARWERERGAPPRIVWDRTLEETRALGVRALSFREEGIPDARSYAEVPFGGTEPKSDAAIPWDPAAAVAIPGAGFRIAGYIDRLDLSPDGESALVRDYKTGKAPSGDITIGGGTELQRYLYAVAARELLGDHVDITASLLYPRENLELRLADPDKTLHEVAGFLEAARDNLAAGGAVMGTDTGGSRDDLAFALPANAGASYCERKREAAKAHLGPAAEVWGAR